MSPYASAAVRDEACPPEQEHRVEEVLARAERFVIDHAATDRQKQALNVALSGLRKQLEGPLALPCVELPLAVCAALRMDEDAAIPLAVATTMLFLGIDILDDLADGDLPSYWAGFRQAEMHLLAATLLSALPQLALSELATLPERRDAMQRSLASGLLRMSAGQQMDILHARASRVSASAVEASVMAKSGQEAATFTTLAAQFAGANAKVVDVYAILGRAIGTAAQLASDCHDVFHSPNSKDLANGTRTLPIALHLERLADAQRADFVALLQRAQTDPAARDAVRGELLAAGELRRCAVVIEVYCQRALRSLHSTAAREPGQSRLRQCVRSISLFPGRDEFL